MKISASISDEEKDRLKVVRRDTLVDVPGRIIEADDATGTCRLRVKQADGSEVEAGFRVRSWRRQDRKEMR